MSFTLNRAAFGAGLVALLLAVMSPAAMARPKANAGGQSVQTLQHGGLTRSFVVHDFSRGRPAPLVILMHGGGGNAQNAIMMTQFDVVAKREGLIAVYPDGTSGRARGRMLTWNAGHCCAAAMQNKVDDVGFIGAIIDRLVAEGKADPARVYVTGMSNGAMMSHRVARELSPRIAAIAPVVGAVFGDEPAPVAAVPAMIIVGAVDERVPSEGGELALGARGSAADRPFAPAIAAAEYWADAAGCTGRQASDTPQAQTVRFTGCKPGVSVEFHSIIGGGHSWPGGRPGRRGASEPVKGWNASEQMWAFFKAHRR